MRSLLHCTRAHRRQVGWQWGLQQPQSRQPPSPARLSSADAFTAGFLLGQLRGWPLISCARSGCAAGAAAVMVLGTELTEASMRFYRDRWLPAACTAAVWLLLMQS